PLSYILQTLTGMLCTGRQHGVLACMVLTGDYPIHEYTVSRHPAAEQRILDAVAAWWMQYDNGMIAAPAPLEELELMLDNGTHIDWSGNAEMRAMLEERRELKAQASITSQRLGELDYAIKNNIGQASTAWLEGWSLSFRRYHRAEYTVPARAVRVLKIREIKETMGEL